MRIAGASLLGETRQAALSHKEGKLMMGDQREDPSAIRPGCIKSRGPRAGQGDGHHS